MIARMIVERYEHNKGHEYPSSYQVAFHDRDPHSSWNHVGENMLEPMTIHRCNSYWCCPLMMLLVIFVKPFGM
jgi:hypothetical protein